MVGRTQALGVVVALALTACSGSNGGSSPAGDGPEATQGTGAELEPMVETVPLCGNVAPSEAPAEWYLDAPAPGPAVNPPLEDLQAWARQRPGFEEVWIDRAGHDGWVSLAFSEDADAAQEELRREFPDRAVVVVPVDWTMDELRALQDRVVEAFAEDMIGSGIDVVRGVTTIDFGAVTFERRQRVEDLFSGERVCVSGPSGAAVPAPGPQRPAGDGWVLLAAERDRGEPFDTDLVTDAAGLDDLWSGLDLETPQPEIDFSTHVVVLFGAVYGSSCPNLRLDAVVADDGASLLYPRIVLVDAPAACTSDARPYAFVVAVERDLLPEPPFVIRLQEDEPPPGVVDQETTVTAADLAQG